MKRRLVFTIVCCALMASLFTPAWEQRAGSAANAEPAGAEPAGTQPKPTVVFEYGGDVTYLDGTKADLSGNDTNFIVRTRWNTLIEGSEE